MNSITLLNTGVATLGVVDLPEKATGFKISKTHHMLQFKPTGKPRSLLKEMIKLPPGNWIILGWSDEINSEQAAEICKGKIDHFTDRNGNDISYLKWRNYKTGYFEFEEENSIESFNSLLLSNGITERKLILKQVI